MADRIQNERVQFYLLLAMCAVMFTWGLSVSGYANSYYSAAAAAGAESWKAMFFGSLDAANAITVDKPPLALWPMALSVRVLGLSSWSILLPQAVEGVAAVALLYASVKRATGSATPALLAGAVFGLTPVAVLMFRYNNPDALLTLLILGAAYATQRAIEGHRAAWWLAAAGALVGLGFLTKMLEALMVAPALAITYLAFGSGPLLRRLWDLVLAGVALVVSAGWWVAVVELWPASSRPFIGGSPANSVLELAIGYNGVERLTGGSSTGASFGGLDETNIARIGRTDLGGEVMWLLPAAVALGALAWALSRRSPRSATVRPVLMLWASWLVVASATFAAMAGIFHSYYTVVLTPGIAVLASVGAWLGWQSRTTPWVRNVLAGTVALTALVSAGILVAVGAHLRWAALPVAVGGLAAAIAVQPRLRPSVPGRGAAALAVTVALVGPALFAAETIRLPHTGSGPMAGPAGGSSSAVLVASSRSSTFGFGLLSALSPLSAAVVDRLRIGEEAYTWVAATPGARIASAYELAIEEPVLAIGGYKGTDPLPTLPAFKQLVATGQVHWFLPGGTDGSASRSIENWVKASFHAHRVDGQTMYDLTSPVP